MAIQTFTNWEQLESVMNEGVRQALESASEVALDKLISIIDKNIYSDDEGWYNRTYSLEDRDNWEISIHKGMKAYTMEINLVPNSFTHNTELLQHTNAVGNSIDIETLAGILNGSISLSPKTNLSEWSIDHDPFWGEFEDWFRTEFTNVFYQKLSEIRG